MAIINSYPKVTPKNNDLLIGTQVADDTVEQNSTKSFSILDVSKLVNKGYKDYVFSFTQNGTNDPVVIELNNNTGLTFTFTRSATGQYNLVPSSSLDTSKTWIQVTGGNFAFSDLTVKQFQANLINIINVEIATGNPVDDVDVGFVELRIYN